MLSTMSIDWKVLGRPGEDNALHLKIDTGQSIHPLLVDCGEKVLDSLRIGEIQAIEHLCFSHLHMDHVCGFDTFFRHNYNRPEFPVSVWGPEKTIELLHHRFRSFVWNLHHEQPGDWVVHEICEGLDLTPQDIEAARFATKEAFAVRKDQPSRPIAGGVALKTKAFSMKTICLPHHTTRSIGYRFQEDPKQNVDPDALRHCGLQPGPWLQALIDETLPDTHLLSVDGKEVSLEELRKNLLVESPGSSLAYLTDFRVEPGTSDWGQLVTWLEGTETLVCESQYRSGDHLLARKNGHMTTDLVGRLSREAQVENLTLIHLSRRYREDEWQEMRDEVRKEFPRASFPPAWTIAS